MYHFLSSGTRQVNDLYPQDPNLAVDAVQHQRLAPTKQHATGNLCWKMLIQLDCDTVYILYTTLLISA